MAGRPGRPLGGRVAIAGLILVAALLPMTAGPAGAASGVNWSPAPVQQPPWPVAPASVYLGNISCLSATDCLASGYDQLVGPGQATYPPKGPAYIYHPLLWRWDGKNWSFEASPVAGSAMLVANSCPAADSCFAVGGRLVGKLGNQYVGVIEHFNGTSWSMAAVPSPQGATFNGVACPSTTDCTAVGTRQTSATTARVLIDHWDGKSWSEARTPSPTGSLWAVMDSVACVSPTECLAIGDYDLTAEGPGYFFGERSSGPSWSSFRLANPHEFNMGDETALFISCPSSSSCLATGSALAYTGGRLGADFPSGMAEVWHGASWAPVTVPGGGAPGTRASLPAYTLDGPSCLSASDCWVAMSPAPPQATFGSDVALGHWDGTHLSAVTLPFLGALEAVSCLKDNGATWCVVLGQEPGGTKVASGQPAAPVFGGDFTVASGSAR